MRSHKKAYHFWLCTQPKMQLLVFPLLLLTSLSKPISPITSSRSPHALFRPSILSLRGGSSPGDSFQSPPPPQHLYNANEYQNEHQHGVQQPAAESNPLLASAPEWLRGRNASSIRIENSFLRLKQGNHAKSLISNGNGCGWLCCNCTF